MRQWDSRTLPGYKKSLLEKSGRLFYFDLRSTCDFHDNIRRVLFPENNHDRVIKNCTGPASWFGLLPLKCRTPVMLRDLNSHCIRCALLHEACKCTWGCWCRRSMDFTTRIAEFLPTTPERIPGLHNMTMCSRAKALERVLGTVATRYVGHAIIPYEAGGPVHMYCFPQSDCSTAFATMNG